MVTFQFPPHRSDEQAALAFARRVQAIRPEAREQAKRMRRSIAEARAEVERFRGIPETLNAEETRIVKVWLLKWSETAATSLEQVATMLDTLAGK